MSNFMPCDLFTTDAVKMIEAEYAESHNGHCYDLMVHAGTSVFELACKMLNNCSDIKSRKKEVWIFCGKGNNGGDGYIAAALFQEHNIPYRVFATGKPHEGTEAEAALEYFLKTGGSVESELPNEGLLPEETELIEESSPFLVIDALLGTGIQQAPEGRTLLWISYINHLMSEVISIDVPSGLCADTGYVPGHCVRASKTVCMLALKPGLLTGDGVDYTGEIIFESLGIDSSSYVGVFDEATLKYPMPVVLRHYEPEINYLLERNPSSNKGDNGKVLIIAGSFGMGGAAIISGVGALRSGAGLVKVATDPKNFAPLLAVCPELMTVDINDFEALTTAIEWCDVVAAGPGLGCNERTQGILELLDDLEDKTVILDADALNVLSSYEQNYYKENRIITPHPGEAARLLATTIEEVNKDRFSAAIKLYQKYGGVVLLKGAGSIVCDGSSLRIIKEGSPALATGGSGDLLTGIIASLCGQGLSNSQSAVDSACIHGRAAQMCAKDHGIIGTLPLDLCSYIRKLVNARV